MAELSESQRKLVPAILDQLGMDSATENSRRGISAHLSAAHLLVSAAEGEGELRADEAGNIFLTVKTGNNFFPHSFISLSVLCVSFVELPDETLSLLSGSCPDFLEAFDTLVR